jgi:hypothetical protein
MNPSKALALIALASWMAACKGDPPPVAPLPLPARTAPAIPWQPHGFRAPTVRCDFEVPAGLKSNTPMPDHIAELMSAPLPPKVTLIISERVEADVPAARARVVEYFAGDPLTEAPLEGAHAPGQLLTVRRGAGQVESVALLAFPGLPVVEVVSRFEEADTEKVMTFTRSIRCEKGTPP